MSEPAAQALAVRALALAALTGTASDDDVACAAAASPAAWGLCLAVERCAALIQAQLGAAAAGLPAPQRGVLESRARAEAARWLSARAQLRDLGRLAERLGIPLIALKGLRLADDAGVTLDVLDVDVLVPRDAAPRFAAAVDAAGYGRGRFDSPRHLTTRTLGAAAAVEIHVALDPAGADPPPDLWRRATPLPGFPGVAVLAPADHLQVVLWHMVRDHVYRRGSIRDLFLLGRAAAACTAADFAAVTAAIDRDPRRDALRATLGFATRPESGADPFRTAAYTQYRVRVAAGGWRLPTITAQLLTEWVYAELHAPEERAAIWARARRPVAAPSAYRPIALVEQLAPPVGRLVRHAARLTHLAITRAAARLLTWRATVPPPPPLAAESS